MPITAVDGHPQEKNDPWNLSDIYPSISNAVLLSGVSKVFTSINPISSAITGALLPFGQSALTKMLPDALLESETGRVAGYVIPRLGGYALGALAANALGFPITFTGTLFLGISSNALFLGTAHGVIHVASRIFVKENKRIYFKIHCAFVLDAMGHPFTALTLMS